jgi:transcriptional regulator with XRE-family HTH domain
MRDLNVSQKNVRLFADELVVGASPDWFKEKAKERGWDERKAPLIVIEDYIHFQRRLFEASMDKLASAMEVDVCLAINQDFINRIERGKREREAKRQNAHAIQFGVPKTQSNPFFPSIEDKMEQMNVCADGSVKVDFVKNAKNPLFDATSGMDMDDTDG